MIRRAKIRKTHSWRQEAWWTDWSKQWDEKVTHSAKTSNLDKPRRYFQNHRGSVLLAQQHIFKAGGVSPERSIHRDSVSIARKRIRRKKTAQLGLVIPPARLRWCLDNSGRSRIHRPQMAEKRRTRAIQHRRSLLNQLKAIGISECGMKALPSNGYGWGRDMRGQVAKGYRAAEIEITWIGSGWAERTFYDRWYRECGRRSLAEWCCCHTVVQSVRTKLRSRLGAAA